VFDDRDDTLERVIRHVRRPVAVAPALDARVMRQVAPPARRRPSLAAIWAWLARPRRVAVSPLGALALAAAVAVLVVLPWRPGAPRASSPPSSEGPAPRAFQFVLVDPGAASVSLVGDFNDWDAASTPLRRTAARGVWSAVVTLGPGRHRYAFLVDGDRWVVDPEAPSAPDDEFGTRSSVVTVGGT
jgi:hypothetical protein